MTWLPGDVGELRLYVPGLEKSFKLLFNFFIFFLYKFWNPWLVTSQRIYNMLDGKQTISCATTPFN